MNEYLNQGIISMFANSRQQRCAAQGQKTSGFTLVEFAIVMVLSGLALVAIMQAYKIYLADNMTRQVYDRQAIINTSLSGYFSERGRYPCPADPTLPLSDPNAGIEGVPGANPNRCVNLVNTLGGPGNCTGPGNTGICWVAGARVTPGPGVGNTNPDPVFIGAIPYRTLKTGMERDICYNKATGLSVTCNPADPTQYNPTDSSFKEVALGDVLDSWGYQMTYAVTGSQVSTNSFNSNYGAIDVVTETGISLLKPAGSAHYVVIAHGENHIGAYDQLGRQLFPCTGTGQDLNNCDLDGVYVSGLRAMAQGANYFDDIVAYRAYTLSELWKFAENTTGGGGTIIVMYNANPGNVGVGTNTPERKLHVAGEMRAAKTRSVQICDETLTTNCFTPALLGGAGMACPAPAPGTFAAAQRIRFSNIECTNIPKFILPAGQECADPAEFVVGFSAGALVCAPL